MNSTVRVIGIVFVFGIASVAWMILGASMGTRNSEYETRLDNEVGSLWGTAQDQRPPELIFNWTTEHEEVRNETSSGKVVKVRNMVKENHQRSMSIDATTLNVKLTSDMRRKGLMWFSLYDADVIADWSYEHKEAMAGALNVVFALPNSYGLYDDFHFAIDGVDYAATLTPTDGKVGMVLPVVPGQKVQLHVSYKTRGRDAWSYTPAQGVLTNFKLTMQTDFADIDFPANGVSPSDKTRTANGWQLMWTFTNVITGHGVGLMTPQRLQPGELGAAMAFSAPVSLLFFFVVIFVLAMLRKIEIHPFNYLLIAAAFFAFHLLFAYTADRLPVEAAFALSSCVSVALVVSYLRLVVSSRFAFVEAGLAQLIYLVGFSLAHFADGFTGLAITLLAIVTLFLVMQLTGRLRFNGPEKGIALQIPVPTPTPRA